MKSIDKRISTLFNGIHKLFPFSESYEELQAHVGQLYKIPFKDLMNINFTYMDDEGDLVSVSNSFDLQQAKLFVDRETSKILNMEICIENKDKLFTSEDNNFFDFISDTTQTIRREPNQEDLNILNIKEESLSLIDFSNLKIKEEEDLIDESIINKWKYLIDKKLKRINIEFIRKFTGFAKMTLERIEQLRKNCNFNIKRPILNNFHTFNLPINNIPYRINKISKKRISNQNKDNNKIKEMVTQLITVKMEEFKQKLIRKTIKNTDKFFKKMLNSKQKRDELTMEENIIHINVKCNGCKCEPIIGIRYKCSICDNFNYCFICEEKLIDEHTHPFIKIRKPERYINISSSDSNSLDSLDEISNLKLEDTIKEKEISKNTNCLKDNFISKEENNLKNKQIENTEDLMIKIQKQYDLSSISQIRILRAIEESKGNIEEALILLFNGN